MLDHLMTKIYVVFSGFEPYIFFDETKALELKHKNELYGVHTMMFTRYLGNHIDNLYIVNYKVDLPTEETIHLVYDDEKEANDIADKMFNDMGQIVDVNIISFKLRNSKKPSQPLNINIKERVMKLKTTVI